MPGDREDEICQKALQLLAELCSVGAVENENCRDFIYYLRDRARPRLTDSGTAGGAARRARRGGRRRPRSRAEGEFPGRRPGAAERGLPAPRGRRRRERERALPAAPALGASPAGGRSPPLAVEPARLASVPAAARRRLPASCG